MPEVGFRVTIPPEVPCRGKVKGVLPSASGLCMTRHVKMWDRRDVPRSEASRYATEASLISLNSSTQPLGTTNYLYDGTSIVDELDNSGNALARYAATTDVDEPLAEFRSGTSSYYHADGMGSVTSLTNVSATTAASYDYDALGNLSGSTGTLTNPYRFTAREFDVETGVYHYRARYYSPVAGRFLSGDPAGFSGGINLYVYVGNRPTNWVDPFGLRPGDKYPTLRCAGWNAIRDINTTSRQRTPAFPNGREYGGWMYENSDGTYSYTAPVPGGPSGVDPHNFNPVPPNAVRAGDYHTHGAYDPNFNLPGNPQPGQPGYNWHNDGNEVFSPDDKAGNEAEGYLPGFLGTPQGTTEEYIPVLGHPGSGQVVVLSGRNCGCH